MADQAPENEQSPTTTVTPSPWKHPAIILGIITLIFGVPGVIHTVQQIRGPGDQTSTYNGSESSQVVSGSHSTSPPPSETTAPSVGGCFRGADQVACSSAHDHEVTIGNSGCSLNSTTRFMGGNPDVDVLRSGLSVKTIDGGCQVSGPVISTLHRSVNGILATRQGDVLRACFDQNGQEVGCDASHRSELIARTPSDVECEDIFQNYTNAPFYKFANSIELRKSSDRTVECWATVRSRNTLSYSLRNLGEESLTFD